MNQTVSSPTETYARRRWIGLWLKSVFFFSTPARLWAGVLPFASSSVLKAVLRSIGVEAAPERSDTVKLDIPALAEDGALVPVTLADKEGKAQVLYLVAENNPGPLLATFTFKGVAAPSVSMRIKLNESGRVLALAQTGTHLAVAEAQVRVTVGGCG